MRVRARCFKCLDALDYRVYGSGEGRSRGSGRADKFGGLTSAFTSVIHRHRKARPTEEFHIVVAVTEGYDVLAVDSEHPRYGLGAERFVSLGSR